MYVKLTETSANYCREKKLLHTVAIYNALPVQELTGGLCYVKVPKERVAHDQWYHLLHTPSLLVIGSVPYSAMPDCRVAYAGCTWIGMPEIMQVIAYSRGFRTIFNCKLRYEICDE